MPARTEPAEDFLHQGSVCGVGTAPVSPWLGRVYLLQLINKDAN